MNGLNKSYANLSVVILLLRLILGIVFIVHGWQKVGNLSATVEGMTSNGLPEVIVYLVSFGEFLGGIALVIGLLTKIAAGGIAIIMAGAAFIVHWSGGFLLSNNGYEYALTLLIISIVVLLSPPGDFSLDKQLFGKSKN